MRRPPRMRSFFRSHWKAIVAIVLLVLLALVTVNPGAATLEPRPAVRLQAHVLALQAPGTPDTRRADAAAYIDSVLRLAGYRVRHRAAPDGGTDDLEATLAGGPAHGKPERTFVIGVRLDPQQLAAPPEPADPGAPVTVPVRDDAGAAAAVLEVARLLKDLRPALGTEIRFVFLLGPRPQSMQAPAAGGGSFVAYVGTLGSARRVQDALAAFQGDVAGGGHGLAAPAYLQGVTLSTGAGHGLDGASALTVTDTAFDRFPYRRLREREDEGFGEDALRDGRDYEGIARVVEGLARTVTALAAGQRG